MRVRHRLTERPVRGQLVRPWTDERLPQWQEDEWHHHAPDRSATRPTAATHTANCSSILYQSQTTCHDLHSSRSRDPADPTVQEVARSSQPADCQTHCRSLSAFLRWRRTAGTSGQRHRRLGRWLRPAERCCRATALWERRRVSSGRWRTDPCLHTCLSRTLLRQTAGQSPSYHSRRGCSAACSARRHCARPTQCPMFWEQLMYDVCLEHYCVSLTYHHTTAQLQPTQMHHNLLSSLHSVRLPAIGRRTCLVTGARIWNDLSTLPQHHHFSPSETTKTASVSTFISWPRLIN